MPRVTRQPRNSVNDRPGAMRLLLRRGWRLLRPARSIGSCHLDSSGAGASAPKWSRMKSSTPCSWKVSGTL